MFASIYFNDGPYTLDHVGAYTSNQARDHVESGWLNRKNNLLVLCVDRWYEIRDKCRSRSVSASEQSDLYLYCSPSCHRRIDSKKLLKNSKHLDGLVCCMGKSYVHISTYYANVGYSYI